MDKRLQSNKPKLIYSPSAECFLIECVCGKKYGGFVYCYCGSISNRKINFPEYLVTKRKILNKLKNYG